MQNFIPESKTKRLIEGYKKEYGLTYSQLGNMLGVTGQGVGYVLRKKHPEEHMNLSSFITMANMLKMSDREILDVFGR